MNNMKKLTAILLALAMTVGLVMPTAASTSVVAAEAATTKSVEYVDENGATQTVTAKKIESGSTTGGSNKMWSGGWYYVEGITTIGGGAINVSGDVKLILCDGATLTSKFSGAGYGIELYSNAKLTIYGQSAQTGELKSFITTDAGDATLTINGGKVTANDQSNEMENAGISTAYGQSLNMTVNGGEVTATGGDYLLEGLGLRYGINLGSGSLTVNGGKVTAIGGSVTSFPTSKSYGIKGNVIFNGGTLIAKTTASSGTKAAFSTAPDLSGSSTYCWRTDASDNFTASTATAYSSANNSKAYVELTTQPSGGGYLSYMAWDDTNKKLTPAFIVESECTVVTSATSGEWKPDEGKTVKWYVVKENVTINSSELPWLLWITGNVNLILCDGAKLTVEGGAYITPIQISDEKNLTIYGQSGQTGELKVVSGYEYAYAIENGGDVIVNGGVLETKTSRSHCISGPLMLNNGTIKAEGENLFNGSPNLPSAYYWRTTADGKYKTQAMYTDSALSGTYFEVTTTKPADSLLDRVGYLDWDSTKNKLKTELSYCYDAVEVTNQPTWGEEKKTTWYYVEDNVTINSQVNAFGDVHLILCDGATLTVEKGVVIKDEDYTDGENSSLTIYGQSDQTGKLVANGGAEVGFSAGIKSLSYGELTINGGVIEATGGNNADDALVTMSYGIDGTYIVINGGKVKATGGTAAPYSEEYNNTYSGGIKGWELHINGGEVTATSGTATGANGENYGIQGTLEITDGTVIAKSVATSGKAVNNNGGTLNLPTTFWWRTSDAADAKYKTQNAYANSALSGTYFELTTTRPEAANIHVDTPVSYLDWDSTTEALVEMKDDNACTEYILVKSGEDTTWKAGWYVVSGNVTIDGDVIIDGDVHLILCDGATLTVNGCVDAAMVGDWDSLSVHGQSTGDEAGKMTVQGNTFDFDGDGYTWSYGLNLDELCVYGGEVTVSGQDVAVEDKNAYSYGVNTYEVTVYGGKLTATGGKAEAEGEGTYAYSVGIHAEDDLSIYGGVVKATGSAATGDAAYSYGIYADEGYLSVYDAEVTATGGEATGDDAANSYGIYAYYDLTIENGSVNATGGNAAAEGESGNAYSYGLCVDENLTIEGGTVIAKSDATTGGKALIINDTFTLPTTYWWRTMPCIAFTANSTAGYVNGQNAYAELTADASVAQAAPRAHTFGDWVDELPATCQSTGTAGHKDCSVCGGHFDIDGAPITDLTLAVDPNNHVGMLIWDNSVEAHWQYYSCCPDAKTAAAAHAFSDEGICICGRKQYVVTWNFNGGKLGEQTSQIDKLAAGAAITAPETPTLANTAEFTYTFAGWYTAAEGGDRVTDFGTVSGDVTYYAHWHIQRNGADAPAESPNTGDLTAALCLALSLFSLTGAALLLCGKKRKSANG